MCSKAPGTSKNFFEPRKETSTQKRMDFPFGKRLAKSPIAMPDQFLVFEKVLKKRRRTWKWRVCTPEGDVIMHGSESSRPAAGYQADRALFLLLLSGPYQSIRLAARAKAVSKVRRDVGAESSRRREVQPGPERPALGAGGSCAGSIINARRRPTDKPSPGAARGHLG